MRLENARRVRLTPGEFQSTLNLPLASSQCHPRRECYEDLRTRVRGIARFSALFR